MDDFDGFDVLEVPEDFYDNFNTDDENDCISDLIGGNFIGDEFN